MRVYEVTVLVRAAEMLSAVGAAFAKLGAQPIYAHPPTFDMAEIDVRERPEIELDSVSETPRDWTLSGEG